MVNKPLIRPYFWGGTLGGGWLTSHNKNIYHILASWNTINSHQPMTNLLILPSSPTKKSSITFFHPIVASGFTTKDSLPKRLLHGEFSQLVGGESDENACGFVSS